ncbi:MAG TPA: Asp-tRNA(Asn)/Glu-tRNA(Gln) amidotransferase subunit GatC [Dongiaceae bacterium]|jgi:aspartyl-tRNA(Asn)/glutamyl-tRNA(Gln) amidotransferase subunit C|nr:Asp-tRNA(Asn)/Glu-tRNA(Gln) amidotransferase subunit GatC [Dongiaceae bacterium]
MIDEKTVAKVARLARLALAPEERAAMAQELNGILTWVEQLNEVDTSSVRPFFEDEGGVYHSRPDEITDGNCQADILANAPQATHGFFTVPKVVE